MLDFEFGVGEGIQDLPHHGNAAQGIHRAADAGGRSKFAYWAGVAAVSVLFGYGHFYKGPAGILDSGMAGLILGAAYVLSGRDLWVCVLAHGFIDTVGLVAVFLGWSS
jgi:membrane protease YdiL (CAAX protease family)